ncbi:MFS family permease [Rhodococcus sp. PvR044]
MPLVCIYAVAGLQMFTVGVLIAWLPSYFNRYYSLAPDRAGVASAGVFLAIGAGMVLGGVITDRVSRRDPSRKWTTAIFYCLTAAVLLIAAFSFGPGPVQLILLGAGALFSSATSGGVASIVIMLTHPSLRASALGVGTMSNSIFGLALGPVVVGMLADRHGLSVAMQIAPLAYVIAIGVLILGKRSLPGPGTIVDNTMFERAS